MSPSNDRYPSKDIGTALTQAREYESSVRRGYESSVPHSTDRKYLPAADEMYGSIQSVLADTEPDRESSSAEEVVRIVEETLSRPLCLNMMLLAVLDTIEAWVSERRDAERRLNWSETVELRCFLSTFDGERVEPVMRAWEAANRRSDDPEFEETLRGCLQP